MIVLSGVFDGVLTGVVGAVSAVGADIATNSVPSIEAIDQILAPGQADRAGHLWDVIIASVESAAGPMTAPRSGTRETESGSARCRWMVSNATDAPLLSGARSSERLRAPFSPSV